jgi:lipoprotein-anchoring transpeptidase ErfK/SrfK
MTNNRFRAADRLMHPLTMSTIALLATACIVEGSDSTKKTATADSTATALPADTMNSVAAESADVSVPAYDVASLDTAGLGAQMDSLLPPSIDSAFPQITAKSAVVAPKKFPLRIPNRGPVALQLQVMLDRAGFSPGIIDGNWGKNAAKALMWFRVANGMDSTVTKSIDRATYDKLAASGKTEPIVTAHEISMDDMEGPFLQIPDGVYDQAKLRCLCYTSPAEELAELYHTSEAMLRQLNPKVDLKSLKAGMSLQVPNVETPIVDPATRDTASQRAARIVISRTGYWTHLVDGSGNIVAHFPSTLGAGYDPSPTGGFRVTHIAREPGFKYQPALMAEVPDTRPTAKLPPGPNSPVGVVWMALSKPHYGIHGTSSPETIGYANSHGCVRLTNWDADRLASIIRAGTPVEFQ